MVCVDFDIIKAFNSDFIDFTTRQGCWVLNQPKSILVSPLVEKYEFMIPLIPVFIYIIFLFLLGLIISENIKEKL